MKKTTLKSNKRQIALLVPAHNEEKVIGDTLKALLKVAPSRDIFVVDDGSTDKTTVIAKSLVKNVLTLNPNQGKATAMNTAIAHFKFARKYKYVMPMDADTSITPKFLQKTLPILEKDKKHEIICVVGKVIGRSHCLSTAYRLWEYEVAQTIHKRAQAIIDAIIVCPGCATVYRSELFDSVQIPTGTMTEDMDFTFEIHRKKLGKIAYTDEAIVITQDPNTIRDFMKQVNRWYTGFWQCLIKHNIPWGGQTLDLEVGLLALEGLYNGFLSLAMLFLLPSILLHHANILATPLIFDFVLFQLPTVILTIARNKSWNVLRYLPQFYFMRALSSLLFFRSFLNIIFATDLSMGWNKARRYTISPRIYSRPDFRLAWSMVYKNLRFLNIKEKIWAR